MSNKALEDMNEPELKDLCNKLAREIEKRLPKDVGFMLLFAPNGSHGIAQYVSNVERGCGIAWLKETHERLEKNQDVRR